MIYLSDKRQNMKRKYSPEEKCVLLSVCIIDRQNNNNKNTLDLSKGKKSNLTGKTIRKKVLLHRLNSYVALLKIQNDFF